MIVEQHSLCWLTGRLADNRNGDTWAEEFRCLPNLEQLTRDGGSGFSLRLQGGEAVLSAASAA
jgi:hypothetical protein